MMMTTMMIRGGWMDGGEKKKRHSVEITTETAFMTRQDNTGIRC